MKVLFTYKFNFILCIEICFLMAMLTFLSVYAEENEPELSDNNAEISTKENTKKQKHSIGKRSRVKTLEEFTPSEEVSADKPVAFPSDI